MTIVRFWTMLTELLYPGRLRHQYPILRMMNNVTGLDCTVADRISVKNALPIKQVPEGEKWRLGLLDHLLELRSQLEKEGSDVKRVVAMLSSLCTT